MPKAKRRGGLIPWSIGLVLLLAPARLLANTGDDKAGAEALFEQGKELVQEHKYAEACAKFEASQALDSGIGTLLYLGDCYEQLGRTASAWAAFREAASLAAAARQEQRQQVAEARIRALEPRLVKLTVEVSPENTRLPGFELRRDGVLIPKGGFGVAIPVDPGEHGIVASAPNKQPYTEVVTVQQESRRLIVPELRDAPPSARREPRTAGAAPAPRREALPSEQAGGSATGKTQRALAYAAGTAGLVGLGLGGYFGVVALDRNAESKDQCRPGDPSLCSPRGVKLRGDAQSAATVSTIAFAAGGTLLATGFVLWLAAPRNAERKPSVALSTLVTPAGPAVELGGRW